MNILLRKILLGVFQFCLEKESAINLPSLSLYSLYLILVQSFYIHKSDEKLVLLIDKNGLFDTITKMFIFNFFFSQ